MFCYQFYKEERLSISLCLIRSPFLLQPFSVFVLIVFDVVVSFVWESRVAVVNLSCRFFLCMFVTRLSSLAILLLKEKTKNRKVFCLHWRIQGGHQERAPPLGPISFIFMQFSGKFPPRWELVLPSTKSRIRHWFILNWGLSFVLQTNGGMGVEGNPPPDPNIMNLMYLWREWQNCNLGYLPEE